MALKIRKRIKSKAEPCKFHKEVTKQKNSVAVEVGRNRFCLGISGWTPRRRWHMGWGGFGQAENENEDPRQRKAETRSRGSQWHGGRGVG